MNPIYIYKISMYIIIWAHQPPTLQLDSTYDINTFHFHCPSFIILNTKGLSINSKVVIVIYTNILLFFFSHKFFFIISCTNTTARKWVFCLIFSFYRILIIWLINNEVKIFRMKKKMTEKLVQKMPIRIAIHRYKLIKEFTSNLAHHLIHTHTLLTKWLHSWLRLQQKIENKKFFFKRH